MTADELLNKLDGVRARGTGKWMARCSAHHDNNPSLSISEGERGLLVWCWAGCSVQAICTSLGLQLRDLFFDALDPDPQKRQVAARARDRQRQARERQAHQQGTLIDTLREADAFIRSRCEVDISTWDHDRLHDELNALADAYLLLGREALHG